MGYSNETTHYGIPLPTGSDLTTPMDYNEAMTDVDVAVFEAKTDSDSALTKAGQLEVALGQTNDAVSGIDGRLTEAEGTISSQGLAITNLRNDVADLGRDVEDAICSVVEETATAEYVHEIGSYFWYNNTLYITTATINVGNQIVPNSNCNTVTIATELQKGQTVVISATGNGVKTVGQVLTELKNGLASSGLQLSAKSFIKNGDSVLHLNRLDNKSFTYTTASATAIVISIMDLTECKNISSDVTAGGFSSADYTSNIYPNEQVIELHI